MVRHEREWNRREGAGNRQPQFERLSASVRVDSPYREPFLGRFPVEALRSIQMISFRSWRGHSQRDAKNGPMISPELFDEFIGSYYKRLIPVLKSKGVKHMFVDTDGDFKKLIPNFIESGVEGFLPMDVNAGMDVPTVRKEFPNLKFIGGFNKICIAEGKDAIDREFERIITVVRQGGYIPGWRPSSGTFYFAGELHILHTKAEGSYV